MNFFTQIADTQITRRQRRPFFPLPIAPRPPVSRRDRAIALAAVREVIG
jgi:hypothetical protein